jgi:hypothetical protein
MSIGFISTPIASASTFSQFMISHIRKVSASKYVNQIPESLLQAECELSSFSNDEIDAAFDYAKRLVAEEKQTSIAVAELRCYLEKSDRPRVDRALFQLSDFALRTVNHIQDIEAEVRDVRADLWQTRSELDLARCRITGMESSKFSAASGSVSSALHLPGWDRE